MKKIILTQTVFTAILAAALGIYNAPHNAISFSLGALLAIGNTVTVYVTWSFLLRKKLIALCALVIVFKYAILGAIIFKAMSLTWLSQQWFLVGLSNLLIAVIFYAVSQVVSNKNNMEIKSELVSTK